MINESAAQKSSFWNTPHIRDGQTLSKEHWKKTAAFLPILLALPFLQAGGIFRIWFLSMVSAIAFDYLASKIFKTKDFIKNGELFFQTTLFSLLLPAKVLPEIILIGVFFTAFVSRSFWGGLGKNPFAPAVFAFTALRIFFPEQIREPAFFTVSGNVWAVIVFIISAVIFFSGNKSDFKIAIIFLISCFVGSFLMLKTPSSANEVCAIIFASTFLATETSAKPVYELGRKIAAFLTVCAALTLGKGHFLISIVCAVLLFVDAVSVWIDFYIRRKEIASVR